MDHWFVRLIYHSLRSGSCGNPFFSPCITRALEVRVSNSCYTLAIVSSSAIPLFARLRSSSIFWCVTNILGWCDPPGAPVVSHCRQYACICTFVRQTECFRFLALCPTMPSSTYFFVHTQASSTLFNISNSFPKSFPSSSVWSAVDFSYFSL